MKFEQALKAIRMKKRVTRKSWKIIHVGVQTLYIDEKNRICLCTSVNDYEMIQIPSEWILAEDWEII